MQLYCLQGQTGAIIQVQKLTTSQATQSNQTNCCTVLTLAVGLNESARASLISLTDGLFSPTELPLSVAWKSLEGSFS